MTTTLSNDLTWRGLIKQTTDPKILELIDQKPMTLYCGFDPTADSLHVGSLLPLMTLKRFADHGHKVIALVGGATGMIGDPSGKSTERSLLGPDQLAKNLEGISKVIHMFLGHSQNVTVLNNADWFKDLSYTQFLRDVGKHFTVNMMLSKESVRARLEDREHGISYTEFSYMLLQAYDFFHLYKHHDCSLQIGGSDQWGNITAGTDLIRKINLDSNMRLAYGITHPLISKSDGTKFGKSESGAVWLDEKNTSPYAFYQFWLGAADADVIGYLKYLSLLPQWQISELETLTKTSPEKREAQKTLAAHLTELLHGKETLKQVQAASQALFGQASNSGNDDLSQLDASTLEMLFKEAPRSEITLKTLEQGTPLIDLLVNTGLCSSKGMARKEIQGGGIYVNQNRVSDPSLIIDLKLLIAKKWIVLRRGKKTYHLVGAS